MKLVYTHNPQREARTGDVLTTHLGQHVVLQDSERPRHAGSTGKVYVSPAEDPDGHVRGYYPDVVGLQWVDQP